MWSSTEEARTQTTRTTAARGCGVPAGTKPLLKWRERATPRKKGTPMAEMPLFAHAGREKSTPPPPAHSPPWHFAIEANQFSQALKPDFFC